MTWVLSRPITSRIDIQLREMTKVDYHTSEQSSVKVKQESTARMKEDRKQMSLLEARRLLHRAVCFQWDREKGRG